MVTVKSPHSYIVETDGARQHVHANKLRRYDVRVDELHCCHVIVGRVNTCSVVYERDEDFGSVEFVEPSKWNHQLSECVCLPSQRLDKSKIDHLTELQQSELLAVLDRYPECFVYRPGFFDIV